MARISVSIAALTLLILVVTGQLAKAQSPEEWREAEQSSNQSLQLDQSYHGTRPGNGNTLPRVEELKTLPGSWVTWPGFVMRPDGGSRIFIQTTQPLEYTKSEKKKKQYLHFKSTQIHLSNNRNPLVTLHFNTPVKRTYLKRKTKNAVDLVIEFKVDSSPAITQMSDQDGYHYMFIDFPPGQYPVGGDIGTRPSFYGVGSPGEQSQASDSELPPAEDK